MTPIVSVVIPSYNHERFVKECIKSVLNQSFQDFEIIITDDGSIDRTVKIIKGFRDPRIKLFVHAENKGACVAANNCIKHAKGRYIAMLSSDDIWRPEKLAVQVKYMDEHPGIAAVFGKVDWIDENNDLITHEAFPYKDVFEVKNRTRHEWLGHFFLFGNCLCHPCSLIRKEAYDEVGLLNPAFANIPDFDLWIRLCLKYDIHILDQRLIYFRRMNEEKNASGDNLANRVRNRFEYKQVLNNYLKIQDPKELLLIFPEAVKYGKVWRDLIPFFLGRIAIDSGVDFMMLWGLENIYTLLGNKITAQKLERQCDFTHLDFIRLAGECDPYKVSFIPIQLTTIKEQTEIVHELNVRVAEQEMAMQSLAVYMAEIKSSKVWKFALLFRQVRIMLAPPNSRRARMLGGFARVLFLPLTRIGRSIRIMEDLSLIRSSGLFDATWYLSNNPDVAEAKIDPARHYLLYGGFERRDPHPGFCSGVYLDTYEDVRIAEINPLVHFLKYGMSEGRVVYISGSDQTHVYNSRKPEKV